MAVLYVQHYQQFFDGTGEPLAYGKLYTYSAGTTSPKATYTDAAAGTPHPNPIILDASGKPDVGGCIFLEGSYKFVLHDADDVPIADGTRDNITSFTAYSESNSGFFQSFSGDAATTTFTLSDDLGSDEKSLMVFSEIEYSTNGTFATDSSWTKGAGWNIAAGVATATGAISTALEQTTGTTIIQGKSYLVKYTITRSAGTITPSLGGTAGTGRTASGTYSEVIIASSTQTLSFGTTGFTGTVDNVSVRDLGGITIRNPADYTLNGDQLIFIKAPATGTNNIFVFAPYTLIGAAGAAQTAADAAIAAQAAAELAETNAETAETNAEAAAATVAGLKSTSTTSLAVGTGGKSFTTQSGKGFIAGMWLLITSDANPTNYMHGYVSSYVGTTLVMVITSVGGSGTLADWTITLSGTRGATGADGAIGNFSATATATLAVADLLLFSDNSAAGASRVSTPPNIDLGIFGSGSATDGKVLTADGAGGADWEEPLPSQSGNSGKYLTTNGTTPSWAAVTSTSGLIPIKTVTVSSPVASVDFVNGSGGVVLDGTYKAYLVVGSDYVPSTDVSNLLMRTSTNAGSSYDAGASDYQYGLFTIEGGGSSQTLKSSGATAIQIGVTTGNAAGESMNFNLILYNPSGTTNRKFVSYQASGVDGTTQIITNFGGGCRSSTADVDGIRFLPSSGNIASGTFTLYGMKGA